MRRHAGPGAADEGVKTPAVQPGFSHDTSSWLPSGLPVLVLIVLFSQYFRKLYIPLPRGHK